MQVYTLADFASGACRAKQTLVSNNSVSNLSFMPSLGLTDESAAAKAVDEVDGLFDYILLDRAAPKKCDGAIIVTEPFVPSLKSADCCKAKLVDSGIKNVGLIVNKLNGGHVISGDVMTAQEIAALLRLPLKAVIPEDLALPLGKWRKSTLKAFSVAADSVCGKKELICNVLRDYFGINGFIKRKMRERL